MEYFRIRDNWSFELTLFDKLVQRDSFSSKFFQEFLKIEYDRIVSMPLKACVRAMKSFKCFTFWDKQVKV